MLVFSLCLPAFASAGEDDLLILDSDHFNTFGNLTASDYNVQSVQWAASFTCSMKYYQTTGTGTVGYDTYVFALSSSSPSASYSCEYGLNNVTGSTATLAIPAGTLTVNFDTDVTSASFSNAVASATVSFSGSTLTVVSEGKVSPITLKFSLARPSDRPNGYVVSASFSSSSGSGGESGGGSSGGAGNPSASMSGIQGFRSAVSAAYEWETYNNYIGVRKIMYGFMSQGPDDGPSAWNHGVIEGEEILYDMAVDVAYNGWKWKIDPLTGDIVFTTGGRSGSWLDMIFRYLTYDYYWGSRLWSGDVSGSWYGAISDSFAYLNYRVNQILQVLANDEDLKIKDATDSERQWVQDYFENGSDIADSGKYDKLNSTSSAFKDAFAGAPDSSISDGFTAVNDNGYDFWSASVSADINGESSVSTFAAVPYDQQVRDLYSENFEHIRGGTYD